MTLLAVREGNGAIPAGAHESPVPAKECWYSAGDSKGHQNDGTRKGAVVAETGHRETKGKKDGNDSTMRFSFG